MSGANTGHWLALAFKSLHIHVTGLQINVINLVLRKTGHFLGYGFLGALLFRALRGSHLCLLHGYAWWKDRARLVNAAHDAPADFWRWSWAAWALGCVFLVAAGDETHQAFLPGRTSSPWDVLLDCCGATLMLCLLWLRMRRPLPVVK